uniref:Meteorin, glial cell differentiation regulator n=1 Tax=Molossus molossus TaxID=27622 RepID=A0A7J8J125_MOLMO|nr:meteorin, glial cell differentiation regulator [Molossus molossus]
MARSGCLVTCPLPPASGWWGEALGHPEEGRAYTDHIPCMPGVCRPCSDTEFLLALCTSDFGEGPCHANEGRRRKPGTYPPLYASNWPVCLPAVIHGTIHRIAHDTELQESVITVAAVRVFRQTLPLFQGGLWGPGTGPHSHSTAPWCLPWPWHLLLFGLEPFW